MASKATARTLDMTNVKEGGKFNQSRIPAGDYAAIIVSVEDAITKEKKQDSWVFAIKIKSRATSVFRYQCILQENMLWKVRNLAIAAGKTVPKKKLKLDPNQLVGKVIGVTIEDAEDYNDKEQSEIGAVFPAAELNDDDQLSNDNAELDEDDDEDEEEESSGPRFTPSDDEDEEEDEADDEAEDEADDEEEEAGEDLSALNRAELKERIRGIQADFQVRKSHSDDDLRGILEGLLAGDDEEEEEAPAPKASRTAARKAAKQKVADDDIDELDIDSL